MCILPNEKYIIARKKYSVDSTEKYREPETPKSMGNANPRELVMSPGKISLHEGWERQENVTLCYGLNCVPPKYMLTF